MVSWANNGTYVALVTNKCSYFLYDKLLEIQKAFYFDVLQHAIAIRSIGSVLVSNENNKDNNK